MNFRTLAGGAVMAAAVLTTTLPTTTTTAVAAAAPDRAVEQRPGASRTALTFTVEDCEGCEIQLSSALGTYAQANAGKVDFWDSKTRTVEDGSVTFKIPTKRTWGMSVAVKAPWEGWTGYDTTVAWAYNDTPVGEPMTLEEALTKTKAAPCWEGTRSRTVSLPLVVEKVQVRGQEEMVPGSIAFVPTTQSFLKPMRKVVDGVLGSQDVNICH